MKIKETKIPGCFILTPMRFKDDRGEFFKVFQSSFFDEMGLETEYKEDFYSTSRKNVLRGLHFQLPPHEHVKMVYCVSGRIYDAFVDIRKGSPTFMQWDAVEIDGKNARIIYLDKGIAHGFYVLSQEATVVYKVGSLHSPELDSGIRWDSAGIAWPSDSPILSDRDRHLPALKNFPTPFTYQRGRQ